MLFSLMNENFKINTQTREYTKLFINILYKSYKSKYYWAKKRATYWPPFLDLKKTD